MTKVLLLILGIFLAFGLVSIADAAPRVLLLEEAYWSG